MNCKNIFILLLILPVLLLSIPGCASSQEEGSIQNEPQEEGGTQFPQEISPVPPPNAPSEPSSPISVELYIPRAPTLNEAIEVTCNVSSLFDMPDSSARIELPDGVSLISGDLTWKGDLKAKHPVSFSAEISFDKAGKCAISASARHMISEKSGWGDAHFVYLNIGATKSEFGWPPTGPVQIVRTDKYSVIKTYLEISHAPKLNEPATLFITTVSPVDFPDLFVVILISPKSAVLSDNDSTLIAYPLVPGANQVAMQVTGVDLQANVPYRFSATVVFRDTGYYHVTAGACQKVDNTIYHGIQNTVYLKIGANESTFEQEPVKETPPESPPPPPAAPPPK